MARRHASTMLGEIRGNLIKDPGYEFDSTWINTAHTAMVELEYESPTCTRGRYRIRVERIG